MEELSHEQLEAAYERVQALLPGQQTELTEFSRRPHTVVVIPSLSLDHQQLRKIHGIGYYEERMLYLLLLLRQPRARVVLVTSQQVDTGTIDYVLRLLPGPEMASARERLTCYSTNDWTQRSLSEKVLERPWLLERIRSHIDDPARAHLVTFNVTRLEMELAVRLGIPQVGNDPRLEYWGTKSGNRAVFREAGIEFPDGVEDIRHAGEIPAAIEEVWARNPGLRRVLVKLNEGFSGEGNAIMDLEDLSHVAPGEANRQARLGALEQAMHELTFPEGGDTWEEFARQFEKHQGIVEAFLEGEDKRSPSVQLRVDGLGRLDLLSSHDQILGGHMNQVFLGCRFPSDPGYRARIQERALRVGRVLRDKGVRGRFGVDFMAIERPEGWDLQAIEVNVRRGGTTHPMMSMHYLVQGSYDQERGCYLAPDGGERCYLASDNVLEERLAGLLPLDLHTVIQAEDLGFDHGTRTGNVFHMLGAASQFWKIGFTSIAPSTGEATALFRRTRQILREAATRPRVGAVRSPYP